MFRPRKASALICVLLLVVSIWALPVFAVPDIYHPKDYISDHSVVGDTEYIQYTFTGLHPLIKGRDDSTGLSYQAYGSLDMGLELYTSTRYQYLIYPLGGPLMPNEALDYGGIDISDFKSLSIVDLGCNFNFAIGYTGTPEAAGGSSGYFNSYCNYFFYDSDMHYLSSDRSSTVRYDLVLPYNGSDPQSAVVVPLDVNLQMQIPEGAAYFVPVIQSYFYPPSDEASIRITRLQLMVPTFKMFAEKNMILAQSETMEAIDDKLGQIAQQPEQEKAEASEGGQSAADELAGALPNESQGFMTAISRLADSMSYNGTEAKLPVPAIDIPAIPGLFDGFRVMEPQTVDFGFWVKKMPDAVLTCVQVVCTLGLIVFCFKELYGLISYAMTL